MPYASKIANNMIPDSGANYPEFQPLFYLSLAKTAPGYRDKTNGCFEMFYAMGNDIRSTEPGFEIGDNVLRVRLIDSDIRHHLMTSPEVEEALRQKLKASMKPHARGILDAVASSAKGDPSGWRNDSDVVEAVKARTGLRGETGSKDAGIAIGYVASLLKGGMAVTGNTVMVPTDVIDAFLEMVDSMQAKAETESLTDMPASPRKGIDCRKCDYFQACTRDVVCIDDTEDE